MRGLKLALVCIALSVAIVCAMYFGYAARMTYTGYCHASGKFLTDEEKIRLAVADVLKRYPPAMSAAYIEREKLQELLPLTNPIHYQDSDEFLSLNPACCSVTSTYKGAESFEPRFLWRIAGGPSGFVNIHYAVRYLSTGNESQSTEAKTIVPISNCGKSVYWWSELHSDLFFIIQYFKNKDTL